MNYNYLNYFPPFLNLSVPRNNSAKELSQFAESACAVNRVLLQHNISCTWPLHTESTGAAVACSVKGLSPPSESRLLRRRRAQQSKSLTLGSCAPVAEVNKPSCQLVTHLNGFLFLGSVRSSCHHVPILLISSFHCGFERGRIRVNFS